MKSNAEVSDQRGVIRCTDLVRALCLEALRDYRAYRKIHPEAWQVWACSERKGAARLARRISRLLKRPNVRMSDAPLQPSDLPSACRARSTPSAGSEPQ